MTRRGVAAVALAGGVAMLMAVERPVSARSGGSGSRATSAPAAQLAQSAADRMSLEEFKRLLDAGAVIVLDVRGTASYRGGHIPGSLSVPLDTIGQRAGEWKNATKPIVTYCS